MGNKDEKPASRIRLITCLLLHRNFGYIVLIRICLIVCLVTDINEKIKQDDQKIVSNFLSMETFF